MRSDLFLIPTDSLEKALLACENELDFLTMDGKRHCFANVNVNRFRSAYTKLDRISRELVNRRSTEAIY